MEKSCLVQLDIHPNKIYDKSHDVSNERYKRNRHIYDLSLQRASDYCHLHGIDHIVYEDPKWPLLHPQVNIFCVLEDLKGYDWIICMDIDVIINTRDLILDDCKIDKLNYTPRDEEEHAFPDPRWWKEFNSGCFVYGRDVMPDLQAYIDPYRANIYTTKDQTEMQHFLNLYPDKGHEIPVRKWNNYIDFWSKDLNCFMHFKGGRRDKNFGNWIQTNELCNLDR